MKDSSKIQKSIYNAPGSITRYVIYSDPSENKIIQIDPPNCRCTECLIGEYVPLDLATGSQILEMLEGHINNATNLKRNEFRVFIDIDDKPTCIYYKYYEDKPRVVWVK